MELPLQEVSTTASYALKIAIKTMFPLSLFYYFEIGALLISVLVLYKFNHEPMHWFIPFLLLMVCTELTARYIRYVQHEPNTWLFNISIPVEYFFYGFIIGSLCLTASLKKIIFYSTFLFGIWTLINLFFVQGFIQLNTETLKIGSSVMIFFSCIFFIK